MNQSKVSHLFILMVVSIDKLIRKYRTKIKKDRNKFKERRKMLVGLEKPI